MPTKVTVQVEPNASPKPARAINSIDNITKIVKFIPSPSPSIYTMATNIVPLTTVSAVKSYLATQTASHSINYPLPAVAEVTTVLGGTTNFVYRLTFEHPYTTHGLDGAREFQSAILKHATEYLFSDPKTPFAVRRQKFEAESLRRLPPKLSAQSKAIQIPELFYFDEEHAVLVMEDLCPPSQTGSPEIMHLSIADWCPHPGVRPSGEAIVAETIGSRLGEYLAALHSLGRAVPGLKPIFEENWEPRDLTIDTTFGAVIPNLDLFGVDLPPAKRSLVTNLMLEMSSRQPLEQDTLIMGDFWAGNIILSFDISHVTNVALKSIHVIDWEFATYGPAFWDLAHFAAEAWLYDRFNPSLDKTESLYHRLTVSMFRAYLKAGGKIDMNSVLYYIAGHVCCFLELAPRTEDFHLRRLVASEAVEIMVAAKAKDMDSLKKFPLIATLSTL